MNLDDREWIQHRARELRQEMPEAEVLLWSRLQRKALGYQFRRQYVMGRRIVDFYCPQRRLAIEVDGPTHDPSRDERSDAWLGTKGIRVLRFDNDDVYHHLDSVLVDITVALLTQLGRRPRNRRVR
jgi:very-short-patch-repair endonuclease